MVLARTSTSGERPARLSLSIYLNLDRGEPRFRYMESNRIKRDHLRVVISLERFKRYSLRWHRYICNFIPITLCWLNVESNLIFFSFSFIIIDTKLTLECITRVYILSSHRFNYNSFIRKMDNYIRRQRSNIKCMDSNLWWTLVARWWTLNPSKSSHKACAFYRLRRWGAKSPPWNRTDRERSTHARSLNQTNISEQWPCWRNDPLALAPRRLAK